MNPGGIETDSEGGPLGRGLAMVFISCKAPDTGFTECPGLMCIIMITFHCNLDRWAQGSAAFGRLESRLRSNDLPNATPTRKQRGAHICWTQNPHPHHPASGSQLGLILPEGAPGNVWGVANIEGLGPGVPLNPLQSPEGPPQRMTWPHVSNDQAEKPCTSPHSLLIQNSPSWGNAER